MITIIAGTNRRNSNSMKVAKSYQIALKDKGLESKILNLADLPASFTANMYAVHTDEVIEIIKNYIIDSQYFVFTIPEYNGTFPGALKIFMDGLNPEVFNHKSAMLVGVASGRAGNIVGVDQFTSVLNHLQVEVLSNKLLLSQIDSLLSDNGVLEDEKTVKLIDSQINKFIEVNRLN